MLKKSIFYLIYLVISTMVNGVESDSEPPKKRHKKTVVQQEINGQKFENLQISNINYKNRSFKNCTFIKIYFTGLNLKKMSFKGCTFINQNFYSYHLQEVDFSGCTFEEVNFSGADLNGVCFKDVRFIGKVNLDQAILYYPFNNDGTPIMTKALIIYSWSVEDKNPLLIEQQKNLIDQIKAARNKGDNNSLSILNKYSECVEQLILIVQSKSTSKPRNFRKTRDEDDEITIDDTCPYPLKLMIHLPIDEIQEGSDGEITIDENYPRVLEKFIHLPINKMEGKI